MPASLQSPEWRAIQTIRAAQANVERAKSILGHAVPCAQILKGTFSSYNAYLSNKKGITDIAGATVSREAVVSWVTSAAAPDVHDSFVATNGMVRPSDEAVLFQHAIKAAKQENTTAMNWLSNRREALAVSHPASIPQQ